MKGVLALDLENLKFIVTGLIFIFYFAIKIIKLLLEKKQIKSLNDKQLLNEKILLLIEEAETLFENGTEKKEFVLSSINDFLIKNKINITTTEIEEIIEKIINVSKSINYEGKQYGRTSNQ